MREERTQREKDRTAHEHVENVLLLGGEQCTGMAKSTAGLFPVGDDIDE